MRLLVPPPLLLRSTLLGAFVALIGVTLSPLARAGSKSDVRLSMDQKAYPGGSEGILTVYNGLKTPVYVPGCASYTLERFAEDRYLPLPVRHCIWEELAIKIPPGKHTLKVILPTGARSLLRSVVTFGIDCHDDLPLSSASCKSIETAYSSAFTLLEQEPR